MQWLCHYDDWKKEEALRRGRPPSTAAYIWNAPELGMEGISLEDDEWAHALENRGSATSKLQRWNIKAMQYEVYLMEHLGSGTSGKAFRCQVGNKEMVVKIPVRARAEAHHPLVLNQLVDHDAVVDLMEEFSNSERVLEPIEYLFWKRRGFPRVNEVQQQLKIHAAKMKLMKSHPGYEHMMQVFHGDFSKGCVPMLFLEECKGSLDNFKESVRKSNDPCLRLVQDGRGEIWPPELWYGMKAQIVLAFDYMRLRGYAHMDYKPDNIMYQKDGSGRLICKVGDYGTVWNNTYRVEASKQTWGTHFYNMSKPNADGRLALDVSVVMLAATLLDLMEYSGFIHERDIQGVPFHFLDQYIDLDEEHARNEDRMCLYKLLSDQRSAVYKFFYNPEQLKSADRNPLILLRDIIITSLSEESRRREQVPVGKFMQFIERTAVSPGFH